MTEGKTSKVVHVNSTEEFEAAVGAESGVVLVDFFADRCGPCKALAPIMTELAEDFAWKATIVKLDVDQANEVAGKFGVMSIPTVYMFHNGNKVGDAIVWAHPKENYEEIINDLIKEKTA